jgi:hypothetical protein
MIRIRMREVAVVPTDEGVQHRDNRRGQIQADICLYCVCAWECDIVCEKF